jgi:hypothetical protein
MPITLLQHAKVINYAKTQDLPTLPDDICQQYYADHLISFRMPRQKIPEHIIKDVHGCFRYNNIPTDTDIVCYALQTDSALAPLLLWDIAHQLSVGHSITLYEWNNEASYLEKAYFNHGLSIESKNNGSIVFRKHAALPAEADSGLEHWTFGIPVGPDDGVILNKVVEQILNLEIPHKEILLCGKPSAEFKYLDHVRIVGEDISAPPVKICTKKNRLAQEARYPNLCILHSRVFLPKQFMQAVRKFGDNYPITSFQSLYFDDYYNLIPRRYSDINKMGAYIHHNKVVTNSKDAELESFNKNTFIYIERSDFGYAHPLLNSPNRYITGSLYIAKRNVWLSSPQNDQLNWNEFEDIEFGLRHEKFGIPHRINPYALTQSIISRPILSLAGYTNNEHVGNHSYISCRSFMERLPTRRKPLLKISLEQGLINLQKYQQKYVPAELHINFDLSTLKNNKKRVNAIIQLLYSSRLPLRKSEFEQFIKDYEKWLLGDAITYNALTSLQNNIMKGDVDIRYSLIAEHIYLLNQLAFRPKRGCFYRKECDYFITPHWLVKFGSLISAFLLWRKRKKYIYVMGGPLTLYRFILESTPFIK